MRLASVAILAVGLAAGASGEPTRFVPPVELLGGTAVVPAVFPDGARVELRYPRRLRLVHGGVRPHGSGNLGDACTSGHCGRDFTVVVRGNADALLAGRELGERYEGADGGAIEYWSGPHAQPDWLIFRFGRWLLAVWDRGYMNRQDKALWARSLVGRESPEGYLVLTARAPLRLARAGEHAGPQLMLGASPRRMVLLIRGRCRRSPPGRSSWFSSWCVPHADLRVHVYGPARFADAVRKGLRIRKLGPAR